MDNYFIVGLVVFGVFVALLLWKRRNSKGGAAGGGRGDGNIKTDKV